MSVNLDSLPCSEMDTTLDEESPRARLALLLKHFSELDDDREAWRVLYPIKEVLSQLPRCERQFYGISRS